MLLSASTSTTVPSILVRRFSRHTFNARLGRGSPGQVASCDLQIDHQLGFSLNRILPVDHRIPQIEHQLGLSFHRIPQHVLGLFQLSFGFLQGLGQLVGRHAATELGCQILLALAPLRTSPEEKIDEVRGIHHAVATCADRPQNIVDVLWSHAQLRQQGRHLSSPNPSAATHVHQHQKLQDRCAHVGCGSGIAGRGRGRRSRRSAGRHLHGRPSGCPRRHIPPEAAPYEDGTEARERGGEGR
mmetsp:Transcript_156523/g.499626  ORF Transcript_156523/g.499626 Transcript_156523/m.499626 type:complete len:242 (-) Transcript_156523:12-737(-)